MKTSFLCVIPARLQSTRFPRKILHNIEGLPMIAHVYKRAQEADCFTRILVATDSEEVRLVCRAHNIEAVMTSENHASGFDRVVEVAHRYTDFTHYLNLQGDEPAVHPQTIRSLVEYHEKNPRAKIITSAVEFKNVQDFQNPNQVKVVFDIEQKALYFSRSPIPYFRDQEPLKNIPVYKHQGIYAYEKETLFALAKLSPAPIEQAESLEQLRFLSAGFSIYVAVTTHNSVGVDVPQDVENVLPYLKNFLPRA